MGADGDVIRAGYEKDCGYEKPQLVPPGSITKDNFTEHLGDERYAPPTSLYPDASDQIMTQVLPGLYGIL